jgi:hypothetical protein
MLGARRVGKIARAFAHADAFCHAILPTLRATRYSGLMLANLITFAHLAISASSRL